jgi:glucose-1-phosphate thymidylyltransferase
VLISEAFLGTDPFVMYLGDNLLKEGIAPFVTAFNASRPDALILLQKVKNPSAYGIAELEGDRVLRLVEKPPQPRSDLALVGVYLFTSAIFQSVKSIPYSARGELEITDAIQDMVDQGLRVESHTVCGWWKDTGKLEDMLEANRLVLSTLAGGADGELVETTLEGAVQIGAGSRLTRCTVRGPVVIGERCRLTDAFIGPYTAISDGVVVEEAEIEHSIILENSRVSRIGGRMTDSLIGRDCVIAHGDGRPAAYRFMIGDASQIGIL